MFPWQGAQGEVLEVPQGEGGEQGDALMPALFSLGLHESLQAAKQGLHPDDSLLACLDDVYLVTTRARARSAFDTVAAELRNRAGVEVNFGKCAAWSASGGVAPAGLDELGEGVWRCSLAPEKNGVVVLGAPLGTAEFVQDFANKRRTEELVFLNRLVHVPDLQAAWLLLLFCATPRANHLLRLLPPSVAAGYAKVHDADVWHTLCDLQCHPQLKAARPQSAKAKAVAALPFKLGGLALRSAEQSRDAAYWAAWVDTLKVLRNKVPQKAEQLVNRLDDAQPSTAQCSRAAVLNGR